MMHNILVICLGNICRSPMAEALLKAKLPGRKIMSAGIHAMTDFPADPFSVQVMRENGIDISLHRAQNVTNEIVEKADLILTMEKKHTLYIETYHPSFKGKIMRIGEYSQFDIPDPYLQGIDLFRKTFHLIAQGTEETLEHVLK